MKLIDKRLYAPGMRGHGAGAVVVVGGPLVVVVVVGVVAKIDYHTASLDIIYCNTGDRNVVPTCGCC